MIKRITAWVIIVMVALSGCLAEEHDHPEVIATLDPTPTREVMTVTPTEVVERGCSRLSYNINGSELPNKDYLAGHLQRLNPCYILVMEGLGYAVQLAAETNATVIHRNWSRNEGSEWQRISPYDMVARWRNEGSSHIVRYTTNEPSVNDGNIVAFLRHEEEVMRIARSYGFTVSVGNFGIGRYQPHWIENGIFDNWLRSVVEYGHIIGAHEYTAGLLPFGVGQMRASSLLERSLVQPHLWATAEDLPTERLAWQAQAQAVGELPYGIQQYLDLDYTNAQAVEYILPPYWHLRRADWFLIRADEIGIERPTIVLTEAFWDNIDMDEVQVMRQRWGIDRYMNDMRGINSLEKLWAYYFPTWSPAYAACRQLLWADDIYPEEYAGFTMFTWSSNNHWISFDMSGNQNGWLFELHEMLERGDCE